MPLIKDWFRCHDSSYSIRLAEHLNLLKERHGISKEYRERIKQVWGKYSKYSKINEGWFEYISAVNGMESPYYIPHDIWKSRILYVLNQRGKFSIPVFNDKNYLSTILPDARSPRVIARNINGELMDSSFRPITKKQNRYIVWTGG